MRESKFQKNLIDELYVLFPDCIILKNDTSHIQGFPDLTILYKNKWVVLECKDSIKAKQQPNQDYYVDKCNNMSFSKFIFPENREEVLDEIKRIFKD